MRGRGLTIMVHRDGALESREYHVPFWVARAAMIGGVGALVLAVALAGLYGPIVAAALRAPLLERQVERLTQENQRVGQLARALDEAEARYAHLRGMLGAGVGLPTPEGRLALTPASDERLYVAPPMEARTPSAETRQDGEGPSLPRRWPLSVPAYRTRGLAAGDSSEGHAGIDLAVPVGSDVRAAGGGIAQETGSDPAYGLYVLVTHPEGYESMYGHLSRVLVVRGDPVRAGQVIGLSGNSGRSTAPHLHFEVRRNGRSVDPLTLVREGV
ncbi:MAG: M23 family metallopeptidase [Gemmatimonadetes bacterium]|nr:M23 family metallopeptidase [Gemmatimonadota bacterium]